MLLTTRKTTQTILHAADLSYVSKTRRWVTNRSQSVKQHSEEILYENIYFHNTKQQVVKTYKELLLLTVGFSDDFGSGLRWGRSTVPRLWPSNPPPTVCWSIIFSWIRDRKQIEGKITKQVSSFSYLGN
jgi:hypothetical protein